MLKIFFTLWLLIASALLYFMVPNPLNPVTAINNYLGNTRVIDTFSGVFGIVEDRLSSIPEKQWPKEFEEIEKYFVYDINFLSINDDIEADDLKRLEKGEFVFKFSETYADIVLKRLHGSSWVMELYLGDTEDREVYNLAVPVITFIQEAINSTDSSDNHQVINKYNQLFSFPLKLLNDNELNLLPEYLQELNKNGSTWFEDENSNTMIYHQLDDGSILEIGPAPLPGDIFIYSSLMWMLFITAITAAILAFILPLWRDIKHLERFSKKFGQGDLSARSSLKKRSSVYLISDAFNRMADSITQMIDENKTMSNCLAHDLRTPLSRLRFAVEMLDGQSTDDVRGRYYQDIINNSIDTLDHLIQQMLVLSRYQRAVDLTGFSECNFSEVLKKEVDHYCITNTDKKFLLNIEDELLEEECFIDKRAMLRLFNNLVDNAVRYAQGEIIIGYSKTDKDYCLTVADDGPGIPDYLLENIFKPFSLSDNNHRKDVKNHGLGLAIVKEVAHWHGGKVNASKSEKGGALITFIWPIEK